MSETLTTSRPKLRKSSAELRAEHDAARQGVLNLLGGLEKQSMVPATAFQERHEQLLQARQESGESLPSDAVYADVLQRNQGNDGNLSGADHVAFANMHQELELHATEAAINPAVLGDNKEATIRDLLTDAEALPDDDPNKEGNIRALTNVLANMQLDLARPVGTELAEYVNKAHAVDAASDDDRAAAENELAVARANFEPAFQNNQDNIRVLQLMAAKYPMPVQTPDQQTATPATPETPDPNADLKTQISELERQIGLSYAKREEKTPFDTTKVMKKDHNLQAKYRQLQLELFKRENMAMLRDPNTTPEDRLIALDEFMFASGHRLENQKLEQDGRTRFKKTIHKIGKFMREHPYISTVAGIGLSAGVGILSGGALAGVTAGTLAYIRAEDRHQEVKAKRDRLFADETEDGDSNYEAIKEHGLITAFGTHEFDEDHLDELFNHAADIRDSKFEGRVTKEQRRRLGSIAIGVGSAGIGWAGAHHLIGLPDFGFGGSADTAHGLVDPGHAAPALDPTQVDPSHIAPAPDLYAGPDIHITSGMGGNEMLAKMGIQPENFSKVWSQVDPSKFPGELYKMPDGQAGLLNPGGTASKQLVNYLYQLSQR